MAGPVRILSIDGGGIRGILPGQLLVRLEEILQEQADDPTRRIADHFDLIAGTSTGGILTCAYLCPERAGSDRPRMTAQEAVNIYMERGDEIFDLSLWRRITTLRGILDEKYAADELEEALEDHFEELWLSDLVKPCLVTAYNVLRREAVFFTQHDARKRKARDFRIRDVARATSAAPTYFEVARIKSRTNVPSPVIDGGVFANNPTLCAYAEARRMDFPNRADHPTAKDMTILSLGTGTEKEPYAYKDAKDWGLVDWAKPLISIIMSGVSETIDYQLKRIFESVDKPERYLRIDPAIRRADLAMDNASPENLQALWEDGQEAADRHDEELRTFAKLLIDGGSGPGRGTRKKRSTKKKRG
jgi:patatin-like phospholipase/acyl hydrolase